MSGFDAWWTWAYADGQWVRVLIRVTYRWAAPATPTGADDG